jgi:hypothetical protein
MRRLLLACVLLAAFAAPAAAQSHPCDIDPASLMTLKSPVRVGFCHDGLDEDGNSTILTRFTIRVDSTVLFDGVVNPATLPNAQGLRYYEVPNLVVARGAHAATVSAWNVDGESVASIAEAFGVVGGKPRKPTALRVIP